MVLHHALVFVPPRKMSLLLFERKHMNLRAHWSRNRSVEAHAISVGAIEFPSSSCIIYLPKYSVKLLPASFSLFVQVPVSIPRRFQSTGQRQLSSNSCHTWHFVCLRVLRGREGKVRVKSLDPRMVFSTVNSGKVGCLFEVKIIKWQSPRVKMKNFLLSLPYPNRKRLEHCRFLSYSYSFLIYHQFLALLSIQTRCWSL